MRISIILTALLLSLFPINSYGQITNSFTFSETNIYYHAVDTLISKVLHKENKVKIVITCDDYILDRLPNKFANLEVNKTNKFEGKRKFEGAIWIKVDRINIDEDKIKIFTTIRKQTNNQMLAWEYNKMISSYTLIYKYDFNLRTYKLVNIEEGRFIR